jgi:hypothetical protein
VASSYDFDIPRPGSLSIANDGLGAIRPREGVEITGMGGEIGEPDGRRRTAPFVEELAFPSALLLVVGCAGMPLGREHARNRDCKSYLGGPVASSASSIVEKMRSSTHFPRRSFHTLTMPSSIPSALLLPLPLCLIGTTT